MISTHDISEIYSCGFRYWVKKKKEKQKTVKTFAVVICLFHFMGNKVYFSVPISKACTC